VNSPKNGQQRAVKLSRLGLPPWRGRQLLSHIVLAGGICARGQVKVAIVAAPHAFVLCYRKC